MTELSKAALKTQVTDTIGDNDEELITEGVMRSILDNMIDSMNNIIDDGNPLVDGSGIEINAGQIDLGGALTASAFFTGDFVWDISLASASNNSTYSQSKTQIIMTVDSMTTNNFAEFRMLEFETRWKHETSTAERSIILDPTQAIYTQAGTATGGFEYAADYSPGFNDLSLVNKKWVEDNFTVANLGFVDITGDPSDNILLERDLFLAEGTGLSTGGILSANVTPTLLDISDGSGFIVDKTTNELNPRVFLVWDSGLFEGVTVPNIGTESFTNIAIEDTGGGVPGVFFTTTAFTPLQRREMIVLGTIVHPSGSIIDQSHAPTAYQNLSSRVSDFLNTIGVVTRTGNVYKFGTSGLLVTKTAGESFTEGGNIEFDRKIPDITQDLEQVDLPIVYFESDGSGGFDLIFPAVAAIIPGFWDDLSGTLQTVATNNWSNQRFFFQPSSGNTVIHYGQAEYANKTAALAGILSENFQPDSDLEDNRFAFRGWLIVRGGATDLSNTAHAEFRSAGKFSTALASSGLSTKDEFSDALFHINNAADPSKQLAFDVSGVLTATTRVLTAQNKDGTIALVDDVESKGTGLFNGGFITEAGTQAVSISDGSGIVVNSLSVGENPTEILVSWTGITNESIPTFTSRQQTWLFIDNVGVLFTDTSDFPSKSTFVTNIFLGFILHDNSGPGVIKDTINQPHVANNTNSLVRDHILASGSNRISDGFDLVPGTVSTLELATSDGIAFGENINWHTDRINSNFLTISGSVPITMDIVISDGTIHQAGVTLLDPDQIESPIGTISTVSGNNSRATIQRLYLNLDGSYQLQLGQTPYNDITQAINSLLSDESKHLVWDPLESAIFLGHVIIRKGATNSSNTLDVVILPASEKSIGGGANPTSSLQTIPFQIPDPISGDKILIRGQLQNEILFNEIFFLREFGAGSIDWEIRTGSDFNVTGTLLESGNVSSGSTGTIYPIDPPISVTAGNHLWVVYATVSGAPEFVHGEIRITS